MLTNADDSFCAHYSSNFLYTYHRDNFSQLVLNWRKIFFEGKICDNYSIPMYKEIRFVCCDCTAPWWASLFLREQRITMLCLISDLTVQQEVSKCHIQNQNFRGGKKEYSSVITLATSQHRLTQYTSFFSIRLKQYQTHF